MNDSANIHLCLRCTTPRASRCVCVCVCYMCMCAYPFRRPPLVCESGSKSKPLHLRNSIPAPALQNRGNIPVLILPVQPPRWHSQPQILYLWDGGRAAPTPPSPPACCRPIVEGLCQESCHRAGVGSGLSLRVQRETTSGLLLSTGRTQTSIIWVQRDKRIFLLWSQFTFC